MATTREVIQSLAAGTIEKNLAQSNFTADQFMATLQIKVDGASNGSDPNDTYSWIDYNLKGDSSDRGFKQEINDSDTDPTKRMVTLFEHGSTYKLDKGMQASIEAYEAGQLDGCSVSVKRGIAKRFLFGGGDPTAANNVLHTGLVKWASILNRFTATGFDLSAGQLLTLAKAQELSQMVFSARGTMNVAPNVLYCSQDDEAMFLSAQMLMNQPTTPLLYEDVEFYTFGSIRIVPLDLDDFHYIATDPGVGAGETGTRFILARQSLENGVYSVIPRSGKIIEADVASEKNTGNRNEKGGVYSKFNAVPFNKRAFAVGRIIKTKV